MNEKLIEVEEENSQVPSSRLHSRQQSSQQLLMSSTPKVPLKYAREKSKFGRDVIVNTVSSFSKIKQSEEQATTMDKIVKTKSSLDNDIKMFGLRFST